MQRPDAPDPRHEHPRASRWRDYAAILLLAIVSRLLLLLVAAGARFGQTPDGRLRTEDLYELLVRWDAGWYLRIILTGYEPQTVPSDDLGQMAHAFFPVYPMLVRGLMLVTGLAPELAGVLLSSALFVLALVLVYEYVLDLGLGRDTGLATVLLVCCAPHSFVFSSLYAESAFLALLAAAMLALRRRQYAWAGLAAALLSGTRPNGILFVVFVLVWALRNTGWRSLVQPWTHPGPMLTIVLAPLGLVAYWWFCYLTVGDAFAQRSAVVHGWGWRADWPWENFARHLRSSSTDRFWAWGSLALFGASFALLRLRRYEEFALCLASFLLFWINVLPQSLVRYAVVLFPLYIGLAAIAGGRPLPLATLAAGLAALNAFLVVGFVLHWRISV